MSEENKSLIDVESSVEEYLSQADWRVNANANQGYSLGGLILNVSGKVIANYWLNHIYAPEIGEAHRTGDFHIHDLDMLAGYCAGWSLRTLLTEGFNGVPGKVEAKPPKHLSSAVGQMVNFLGTLQNEWAGAVAFSSFDTYIAPFLRKDNLSYKQVKQGIQELIYNLNVPSRWGSQTPFTNLTFDWVCPEDLREQIPYIGGEEMPFSYGDLQAEMDMINRAFIEVMTEGDAKGRIFSLHPKEKVVIYVEKNQSVIVDNIGNIIDTKLKREGVLDVTNDGFKALSFNFKTLKTEFRTITRFIKHKEANTCVEIKTNTGNEFVVTKGHSLFTFTVDGEMLPVPVTELKEGDFILSAKKFNQPDFKKTRSLPLENIKGSKYTFDSTIELTAELLWLFGFFAGNGNMLYDTGGKHIKGIQLSSTKSDILDCIEEKIRLLSLVFNYKRNESKDITIVSFTIGKLFYDFFNGEVKANTKHVPIEVFSSEHFEEFINGYFTADGNLSELRIRTVSKKMRETLPVLFSYKGYKCYIRQYDYNQYAGMEGRKNVIYQLSFTQNELKKNVFPLWKYMRDNIIKENGWNVKDYENYKRDNLSLGKITELYSCLVARAAQENKILRNELVEKIIEGDLFLEKITRLDDFDYDGYVYDFSVEETEAFIGANSIIFHNTFPIPTYNITPDFPWDSPNTDLLFNMTARYGLPYFQGFINSDLKPNMVRSMCLFPEETILFKNNEQIRKTTIGTLFAEYKDTQLDDEWWQCQSNILVLSLNPQSGKLEWVKVNKFLRITDNRLVNIRSQDGKLMRLSAHHLVAVLTRDGIETKTAEEIKTDDFVLVIKDASHVLNQKNVTDDVEIDSIIIDRWNLTNEKIEWLRDSDFAAVPVASVNIESLNHQQAFYDIELEKNHYFVHSDGNISHNCCRLQLDLTELLKRGNGLFGSSESTGSLGVVTINCARLGYLYKGDEAGLYQHLDTLLELGRDSLEVKREVIQQYMDNGLFPFTKRYLGTLRNHFSTLGVNGINEMIRNFTHEQFDITTEWGQAFAVRLLEHIRARMVEFQEKTGHMYNLEATPAEGTTYRFAKEDKKRYADILQAGTPDRPYYTNSSQLPVGFTDDPFEALALQDELQTKYTGGCIEKGIKVITDKGTLKIEDIVTNFKALSPIRALSYNLKAGQSEWDLITDAVTIDVAKHNKIKITANKAIKITTTDWHPFFILEKIPFNNQCPICEAPLKNTKALGWHLSSQDKCRAAYSKLPKHQVVEKRADELNTDDYILQNAQNLLPEKSELRAELAYLIGFFIGDDSILEIVKVEDKPRNLTQYRIRFSLEYNAASQKIVSLLNSFFDCSVKFELDNKFNQERFMIDSSKQSIYDFLFKYQLVKNGKACTKAIPSEVKRHLSQENFYSFLAGLIDGSGHIDKSDRKIRYETVSEKLAEDIVEFCTIAGIFISKHKMRSDKIDFYQIRISASETTFLRKKLPLENYRIEEPLPYQKERAFPAVKVLNTSKIEVQDRDFYDLTTQHNHNYLAGDNSFVFVHNTVLHLYMNERISSAQACKNLVRRVLERYRLPYLTITPTFSICPVHGYLAGEQEFCPLCDEEKLVKKG